MATGDITATIPNLDGGAIDLIIENFTTGADWDVGSGAGAALVDVDDAVAVLTLTGPGYNADATVNSSAIYTSRLNAVRRKPYPNEASEDQDVAGSDLDIRFNLDRWVWTGYTATLTAAAGLVTNTGGSSQLSNALSSVSVTNNSTLAVPKVLGGWDLQTSCPAQRVSANFTVGFHAYHHFGIACVVITATGATSSHEQEFVVTTRSKRVSARTGLYSEAFEATIPIAGFTQGETISIRARAYPVIGGSGAVLDTADTTGVDNEVLLRSNLSFTCDKTGALTVYASVDPALGNDASGTTTTDPAGVISPYATIQGAISDGATVVRLSNTTHTFAAPGTPATVDHWVTLTPQSGATPTVTTSVNLLYKCRRLKIENCTVSTAHFWDGENLERWLWLHNCTISQTGTTVGFGYRSKAVYITECGGVFADLKDFSTARVAYAFDGVAFSGYTDTNAGFRLMRCTGNLLYSGKGTSNVAPDQDGSLILHNQLEAADRDGRIIDYSTAAVASTIGHAIIGNTFERHGTGGSTSPLVQLWADSNTTTTNNLLFAHNTAVGQRVNYCYNDSGTASVVRSNILTVGNAMADGVNIKGDTFGTPNANRVGNFAVGHGTGVFDNRSFDTTFPADDNGATAMQGFHGPNTSDLGGVGSLGFTDDQSGSSGTGGGDYTPAAGSVLLSNLRNRIITYDLQGFRLPTDGTADIGAYQDEAGPEPVSSSGSRLRDRTRSR